MHRVFAYRPSYYLFRPWEAVQEVWDFTIGGALAFYRRGRHGWAHRDTWNADIYLARVISEMLRHLAETSHGYPTAFAERDGDLTEETGHEQWQRYLYTLAADFEAYVQLQDSMDKYNDAKYRECIDKMRRLFDYYGALWR